MKPLMLSLTILFFTLPAFSQSRASRVCESMINYLRDSCKDFQVNALHIQREDDLSIYYQGFDVKKSLVFGADRCQKGANYQAVRLTYKTHNSKSENQCVIWTYNKDAVGEETVREEVFSGEDKVLYRRLSRDDFDKTGGVSAEYKVNPEETAVSMFVWLGRITTKLKDSLPTVRGAKASEMEVVE